MVSAVAPKARILLVEADTATIDDLGAAVDQAVALGAKYVSNSYGSNYTFFPEDPAESAADVHYDHPGVAVVASSGDSRYGVAYPAASPHVTAVGGTTLTKDPAAARGWSESVWDHDGNGTGSGCSRYEPKPCLLYTSATPAAGGWPAAPAHRHRSSPACTRTRAPRRRAPGPPSTRTPPAAGDCTT